ncbi:MAG: HlyD family efflux transporter periplasmic adaptor subunit, partial [Pseudomonadota bacterium]|nr:HlyD family efflux transporter periplasmic adaptor subunit [Pseudomonadota bacterium]
DTYDLTSVKQLLSREPSDSDEAQDLIEELQDSRETTEVQYEELQRKKKIFELEIQHTYDSAVIAGKLAELTYQQELSDWEETLAEAKQNKADLEKQKALLEAMTDGVLYADRNGTVASVSYEAEDLLDSAIPIVSYYDTDTVSITLEVPQEEIASLAVGDTAEVTLSDAGRVEGTLTEKSVEPEDGTSRTTVNYTATISLDNSDGRLSDGLSATVTFTQETEAVINE